MKKFLSLLLALTMVLSLCACGSSSRRDQGYWGSDGYYHSTESEADAARKRANDWMKENW